MQAYFSINQHFDWYVYFAPKRLILNDNLEELDIWIFILRDDNSYDVTRDVIPLLSTSLESTKMD